MHITNALIAKSANGAVDIKKRSHLWTIVYLGGTVETPIPPYLDPDTRGSFSSLTLYPRTGEEGVIAVAGYAREGSFSCFLRIGWQNDHPFIDLENPWFPTERVGGISGQCLHVTDQKGRRYCSLKSEASAGSGRYYVPDPNLLISYLAGKVGSAELLRAAVQQRVIENEPKLVKRLEAEIRTAKAAAYQANELAETQRNQAERLEASLRNEEEAQETVKRVLGQWWLRRLLPEEVRQKL